MGPIRAGLALVLGAFVLATGARAATTTVLVGPGGTLTFSDSVSGTDTTTVTAGDTVEWQWSSGTHSTTRLDSPETWDSGVHSAPFSFTRVFMVPGTYPYVCTVHESLGMTGTVVVLDATSSTSTTLSPTTLTVTSTRTTTTTTTLPPTLQCEDAVARQLARLATADLACRSRAAHRTFRQKRVREDACVNHARTHYARAARALHPGFCPGCLLGNLAVFRDQVTSLLDELAPQVYCAPALPTGGSVRAARAQLHCESGVARSLARLARGRLHCAIGAADATFTGQPFDEVACTAEAKDRFDGAVGKLRLGLCPPCLLPEDLRDSLASAFEALTPTVFCAH